MRAVSNFAAFALVAAAAAIGGCGGNGSSGAGISTASVLDGAPTGGSSEVGAIKAEDPNARVVQVAWTAARAQRCGFVFDPAKLKSSVLTSEATRQGPTGAGANAEKVYDQTYATISAKIRGESDYCSKSKNEQIKADLQRHLAGNYDPHFPTEQKVAGGGLFDKFVDDAPSEKFDSGKFWQDQAAKKTGAKGGQGTD